GKIALFKNFAGWLDTRSPGSLRVGGAVPRAFRSTGTTARIPPATADVDGRPVEFELAWNRQSGPRYFEPDHLWLTHLAPSGRDDSHSRRHSRLFFGSHRGILRSWNR